LSKNVVESGNLEHMSSIWQKEKEIDIGSKIRSLKSSRI